MTTSALLHCCVLKTKSQVIFLNHLTSFLGIRRNQIPPRALIVIRHVNTKSSLPGVGSKRYCLNIVEIIVFISINENLQPIQFLGPALNGINEYGCRFKTFSVSNLVGLKLCGSGYISGIRCVIKGDTKIVHSFGIVILSEN